MTNKSIILIALGFALVTLLVQSSFLFLYDALSFLQVSVLTLVAFVLIIVFLKARNYIFKEVS